MLPALHSNSDLFDLLLSRDALAGVVAYGATRLACGLAGAPAFAATPDLLFLRVCDGTNHSRVLLFYFVFLYYTTRIPFLQVKIYYFMRFFSQRNNLFCKIYPRVVPNEAKTCEAMQIIPCATSRRRARRTTPGERRR